jgi:acetate kinase
MAKLPTIPNVIWCLNAGSCSLKFALYQIAGDEIPLARGAVERNGSNAHLWIQSDQQRIEKDHGNISSPLDALHQAVNEFDRLRLPHPDAVGHRVVHGGPNGAAPARVTDVLMSTHGASGTVSFAMTLARSSRAIRVKLVT